MVLGERGDSEASIYMVAHVGDGLEAADEGGEQLWSPELIEEVVPEAEQHVGGPPEVT